MCQETPAKKKNSDMQIGPWTCNTPYNYNPKLLVHEVQKWSALLNIETKSIINLTISHFQMYILSPLSLNNRENCKGCMIHFNKLQEFWFICTGSLDITKNNIYRYMYIYIFFLPLKIYFSNIWNITAKINMQTQ